MHDKQKTLEDFFSPNVRKRFNKNDMIPEMKKKYK